MRKLKLQMQVSLDGYVAGEGGTLDWMVWNWDDELKNYVVGITEAVDLILLGRNLAEGFIPHWGAAALDQQNPEVEFAKLMTDTPKIVFSRTIQESPWQNTTIINECNVNEINDIKSSPGKDIIVYGGAAFVSSLVEQGLIDEYHLFINPVALGKGMTIFGGLASRLNLKLVNSKAFDCGIVVLFYQPA